MTESYLPIQTRYHLISTILICDVNYFGLRNVVRIVIKWICQSLLFWRRLRYDTRALVIGSPCERKCGGSIGKRSALLRRVLIFLKRLCLLQTTVLHTSRRRNPTVISWPSHVVLSSTHELLEAITWAPTTPESVSFSGVVRSMTPSSSGRRPVVKNVSNADKTLELEAWPLVLDICTKHSPVTETPLFMFKISNSISTRDGRRNAKTRQITCPLMNSHFPRDDFLGTRQGKGCRLDNACRNLSCMIMGDTTTLPVVPLPLPSDWKQKPSQGNSISRR